MHITRDPSTKRACIHNHASIIVTAIVVFACVSLSFTACKLDFPLEMIPDEDAAVLDASDIDASGIDASSIDASSIDASYVDASEIDASDVDADTDTDAAITCGNGIIEEDEECDDSNTEDGDGCDSNCQIEYGWYCEGEPSNCYTSCGDDILSGNEECDGDDLGGATCETLGFDEGELACLPDCSGYDTSSCHYSPESGLIAYYPFNEGSGDTVTDQSGVGDPLDLDIFGGAEWLDNENGILLDGPGKYLKSATAAQKLYDRITLTGKFTVEAWVTPIALNQEGPARIVSYSENTSMRNFTLGHGQAGDPNNDIILRVRTTETNDNGLPQMEAADILDTELQHVAATYDGTMVRIYHNGVEVAADTLAGTLDNWNDGYFLMLGAEANGSRTWVGYLHEVAIYDRDLSVFP